MILSTFWSRYYSRMMLSTVIIKYLFSNNNYSVKALLSKKNMKNLRKKFCEFPPDSFYLVRQTHNFLLTFSVVDRLISLDRGRVR